MPTLEEVNREWESLLRKAGPNLGRVPIVVADEIRRNPISPDAIGPIAGTFNQIMSDPGSMFLLPLPDRPTNILNVFRAFAIRPMTPAQQDALRAYLIDIYRRASTMLEEVSVPGVIDQLKVKQLSKSGLLGKDFDSTLLRSYFTKSEDPVALEAFKGSLQQGRPGRLAMGPSERGFTRRRTLPPPPGGPGPAAAGAGGPAGGRRRKTVRRRRRTTRSRR